VFVWFEQGFLCRCLRVVERGGLFVHDAQQRASNQSKYQTKSIKPKGVSLVDLVKILDIRGTVSLRSFLRPLHVNTLSKVETRQKYLGSSSHASRTIRADICDASNNSRSETGILIAVPCLSTSLGA
jgi:hypothetical protein